MNADPDGQFVDDMLRQAQHVLGNDPRIHFAHVRHAGGPPAESTGDDPLIQAEGVRSAWSQTHSLAAHLRDLWEHAWLPDPPAEAAAHFTDAGDGIRIVVSARGVSIDPNMIDTARDRLMVRGYIADASTGDGFTAGHGTDTIAVSVTDSDVTMTLSTTVDGTDVTLDMLNALPTRVPTRPDQSEG